MNNTHQRTDEEVFTAALSLKHVEEQDQYVAECCLDDTLQHARVMGLLASHRKLAKVNTTFVLDIPEIACSQLLDEDFVSVGEYIGPYRIMQLLGEGGMGLVYQAEQLAPIRRRVAIKLLKPGMDSHNVLARFELERQALAGMEHPGITRILDAGLADSGRPFFVMELVKGIAITHYCRDHQLQPMDCIQLMIQVCSAIQHAHQRGIIHRDIKPSNILVAQGDNGPVPKIIDFGIAKVVNESMGKSDHFTLHGEMVGTPEYMSPEQAMSSAEGVDTRTDVYSLGVLLYELLTGETPLAVESGVGVSRLRQLFLDAKCERPSQRVARRRSAANQSRRSTPVADDARPEKFLMGDVDCIVMKGLARDPNERYQSVSELKRDLERFVSGLPIEAAAPSLFYYFTKMVKRHRVIAAVISLACFLVLAASTVAIRFGLVANDRLQAVLEMQTELKTERDRALEAERTARLLAQSYLAPAVLDRSLSRFCVEHWDKVLAVNPQLNSLPSPQKDTPFHHEILATVFDSNLIIPDERNIVLGESKWLTQILSKFSKKDVGSLFQSSLVPFALGDAVAIGETSPLLAAPTASPDGSATEAQPLPAGALPVTNPSQVMPYYPIHRFPAASKKAYLEIFCEELRAIDKELPLVADTEDFIGLCLMDMQRPDLAIVHFRESERVRQGYPELHAQVLQTRLFIADCLKTQGNLEKSATTIAQVRSDLAANTHGLDAITLEQLDKAADTIATATVRQP